MIDLWTVGSVEGSTGELSTSSLNAGHLMLHHVVQVILPKIFYLKKKASVA